MAGGCVAEILGLMLPEMYKTLKVKVLTWNSPSWISDKWFGRGSAMGSEIGMSKEELDNTKLNIQYRLKNDNFNLKKFRTHGSVYVEMPRTYKVPGGEFNFSDKCDNKPLTYNRQPVYVLGNYKQLGDENFKEKNKYPLQPPKNDYTYFVRSKASDTSYVDKKIFIEKVDGKNKDLKYGWNTMGKQLAYTDKLGCNGRNNKADRRIGLINLVSSHSGSKSVWPWNCCYDQYRINFPFKKNLDDLKVINNLPADTVTTGGRRKTRKRRKRKGGKKSRKNKRNTRRRKSKKRRRRTRRRKRR